jgi:hypothetical protein
MATRVANRLITTMGDSSYASSLPSLALALKEVSARLDRPTAAAHANKAAVALVNALCKPRNLAVLLPELALAFKEVSARLDRPTAAAHAGKAADALLAALRDPNASNLSLLAQALKEVSAHLDGPGAAKVASALIDASRDPKNISSPFLPQVLLSVARAIKQVCAPISTPEIMQILDHPLAAGPVQRALLDVLGQRYKQSFRCTWHFIDWADDNDKDHGLAKAR